MKSMNDRRKCQAEIENPRLLVFSSLGWILLPLATTKFTCGIALSFVRMIVDEIEKMWAFLPSSSFPLFQTRTSLLDHAQVVTNDFCLVLSIRDLQEKIKVFQINLQWWREEMSWRTLCRNLIETRNKQSERDRSRWKGKVSSTDSSTRVFR